MKHPIKLGIVGCGAITETGHLPACQLVNDIQVTALADLAVERAQSFAHKYQVQHVASDYQDITQNVDAVIIATPPHLHLEQTSFFMERGIHVLCEKPLASSSKECQVLVDLSHQNPKTRLAVGHVRRFFYYACEIKHLIDQGNLGKLVSIQADEGFPYGWPAYTNHAFQRGSAGGVTFDLGIHLLDLFTWFGGSIDKLDYADDAIGGIESNSEAQLSFTNGAQGKFRLSRTCERPNRFLVQGTQGWAQAKVYTFDQLHVKLDGMKKTQLIKPAQPQNLVDALALQLREFTKVIHSEPSEILANAQDGLVAVRWVEEGYRQARNRPLPLLAPIPGEILWD